MNPDYASRKTVDLSDHEVVLVVKSRQTNEINIMELEGRRMRMVIETSLDSGEFYPRDIDNSIMAALTAFQMLEVRIENVTQYTTRKA